MPSSSSPRIPELLAANATFAESYTAPFTMKQLRANVKEAVLVLTCMDPRVVPEQFLGPDSQAAVFRNGGGRVSADVVRTVTVLQSLPLKAERATVMVVHHTDCGMTHLTETQIREDVKKRGNSDAARDADNIPSFGCFAAEDLEKTIREDVEALKAEALLSDVEVRGFVLSTETGLLREIDY